MYSSNPSFESFKSPIHDRFFPTSINPNLSSTNLHSLNYKNVHNSTSSLSLHDLSPKRFVGAPITPPRSHNSTPVKEQFKFYDTSLGSSATGESPKKITILCISWYLSSIVSNYSTKMILSNYSHPITLTQFQFMLNAALCLVLLSIFMRVPQYARSFPAGTFPELPGLTRKAFITPTVFILKTTVPMGVFQFVGHVTSHNATSIIPVSLNHTIKALSPITTVLIYRVFFNKKYDNVTYLTLLPLMLGIMLSCYKSKPTRNNSGEERYVVGLLYSFVSMLIFVSQNIFAKGRLTVTKTNLLPNMNDKSEKKLDKLTILFYCSIIGFLFTLPVYFISEYNNTTFSIFQLTPYISSLILINGVSHFIQSLLAFQILGLISPINYSIANILKRIIIILVAFIIEGKSLSYHQKFGIMLTFVGLFTYDRFGKEHKRAMKS